MFSMQHRPRLPVSTTLVVLLAVILAHGFALSPLPSSAAARQGLNEPSSRLGADAGTTASNTRLIGFMDLFHVLDQIQTGGVGLAGDFNLDGVVDMNDVRGVIDNFGQPDPRAQDVKPTDGGDVSTTDFRPGDDDSPGGNPTVFARIVPGDGFTGDTPQPNPVGRIGMTGYDAKAIARWDVVPYQTFTGEFHVGVVAFHMNGIDRVEFSADGGPWVAVHEMQLNPRTNVWEYTAVLNAADFEDGPVEVRAVAYPKDAGIPRVLGGPIENSLEYRNGNHSIVLNTNAYGSLPEPVAWADAVNGNDDTGEVGNPDKPYRTPFKALHSITTQYGSADGATVYLQPGDYTWGRESYMTSPITTTRWATLTPAADVLPNDVRFYQEVSGGFRTRLLRAYRIHFDETDANLSLRGNPSNFIWVDTCTAYGKGPDIRDTLYTATAYNNRVLVTDTFIEHYASGIRTAEFYRNCKISNISGAPFGNSAVVINCRVDDYNDPMNFHGDLFHWFGEHDDRENFVLLNIEAYNFWTQALYSTFSAGSSSGRMDNVAIVNVHVSKGAGRFIPGNGANGSWWEKSTNHLLIWHVTMPEHQMRWNVAEHNNTLRNVSIIGSVFRAFVRDALPHNAIVRHNHFIENIHQSYIPTGPNAYDNTSGGTIHTLFMRPDPIDGDTDGDYTPIGPLLNRVLTTPVPFDIAGSPRLTGAPIGPISRIPR